MSSDPAAFVAGVPVKISERFRPPRRITIPASCQHVINPDLLTQEYDFAVERTTLNWVHERRIRLEREEKERRARIEEYDRVKLEKKAKEEERLRLAQEEEERQKALKEEETRRKEEEEEKVKKEEELKKEEESQLNEQSVEEDSEDVDETVNNEVAESNGNKVLAETQPSSKDNPDKNAQTEPKQQLNSSTLQSESGQLSANSYLGNTTMYNANSPYKIDVKTTYPDMLKPTPFPSQKDSLRSPLKTPADINFADFEGEANDPFDSAALKSINDLEELAKVLDSSNIRSQQPEGNFNSEANSSDDKRAVHNVYPNGQTTYNTYAQYPYYMQHQQQQNYSQFGNHLGKNSQVTSASSPTVPSYTNTTQQYGGGGGGGGINRTYPNTFYNQQWNNGFNVSSPNKPPPHFGNYDYHLQQQSNNIPKTVSGMGSPSTNVNVTTATATVPVASVSNLSTGSVDRGNPAKRQDLEDFYSKYYSQNKSSAIPANQQSGMRSGDSTPSHSSGSGAAGSTSGSLRSCRSVPDLTAAEDSEVTSYSSRIQSQNEGRIFSHTPPPRPSSTGLSGLEDWKPLPDLSSSPELTPSQKHNPHGPPQHTPGPPPYTPVKSRLPDPFTELTSDAQNLVQSMAEMGFPRPRVARAVQKLGTDHKKLIEVLLVLQSLQDTGEDEYKAELAFYYYMGDLQKTRDHLSAAKQLLDLGFEEERIIDALLKHNNDRDKALEELIA